MLAFGVPALFQRLPWLEPALWTTLTIGGAYLLGHLINLVAAGRLTRWASATHGQWDDILVHALTSRIPLWSVLAGAWLSLGYWAIAERWLYAGLRHDRVLRHPVGHPCHRRRWRRAWWPPMGPRRCQAASYRG